MAVYRYVGIQQGSGKQKTGVIEADSERDARQQLKQRGVFATSLKSEKAKLAEIKRGEAPVTVSSLRGASFQERLIFTQQMASLIEAGFPVTDALNVVEEQIENKVLREVVIQIRSDVSEGLPLSVALSEYPKLFPKFYTQLIKAGESSGALDKVFLRLGQSLDAQQKLRGKITGALIYPLVLIAVSIGIVAFLMTFVVPKVLNLFNDGERDLPLPTKILITINDAIANGWVVIAAVLIGGVIAFLSFMRTSKGRELVERFCLKVPLLGTILKNIITQRLAATLSLLLNSGITIVPALDITAPATGFKVLEKALLNVQTAVNQGRGLAEALKETGFITILAIRMIQAGEAAGNLEAMLDKVSQNYQEQLQRSLERFMNLLGPLIILFVGLVVGFIAVAIMLPIIEMNQLVG